MSKDAEILRYWRMGQYDSAHIADKLGVPEADVYRAVASRERRKPIAPPKPRERRQRATTAPTELKRPMYRLRQGGKYLHQSGDATTLIPEYAWQGNAEAALDCCEQNPLAKNMQMEIVL